MCVCICAFSLSYSHCLPYLYVSCSIESVITLKCSDMPYVFYLDPQERLETSEETQQFQEQCIIDLETALKEAKEEKYAVQAELEVLGHQVLVIVVLDH